MTQHTLSEMFNRAFKASFRFPIFLLLFVTFCVSGLVFIFFQGVALYATAWLKLPLRIIPLFIDVGLFIGAGALSIRFYEDEQAGIWRTLSRSWEVWIRAFTYAIFLVLAFLVLWILIGIFLLLNAIPYLGDLLSVILAFCPFLLNLGVVFLFVLALAMLFYLTPTIALKEKITYRDLLGRFQSDLFSNLLFLGVAVLPVWIFWNLVGVATKWTLNLFAFDNAPLETLLQSLFIMIPLVGILTPSVNFFFNFALEGYRALESPHDSKDLEGDA